MDLCLSPGIVIFIYVGLGIILDLFTGTATFSYAVLGIRMCISPGTRDGARDPLGEANHPWDNNKLRPVVHSRRQAPHTNRIAHLQESYQATMPPPAWRTLFKNYY